MWHVIEIDSVAFGNADKAFHFAGILVGYGAVHFVNKVATHKSLNIVQRALVGLDRARFRVVIEERDNPVAITLVAFEFVHETYAHSSASDDDDSAIVETACAIPLQHFA